MGPLTSDSFSGFRLISFWILAGSVVGNQCASYTLGSEIQFRAVFHYSQNVLLPTMSHVCHVTPSDPYSYTGYSESTPSVTRFDDITQPFSKAKRQDLDGSPTMRVSAWRPQYRTGCILLEGQLSPRHPACPASIFSRVYPPQEGTPHNRSAQAVRSVTPDSCAALCCPFIMTTGGRRGKDALLSKQANWTNSLASESSDQTMTPNSPICLSVSHLLPEVNTEATKQSLTCSEI